MKTEFYIYFYNYVLILTMVSFLLPPEDVKRLNEKLTEANTEKVKLQLKLDELQTSDITVKVSGSYVCSTC